MEIRTKEARKDDSWSAVPSASLVSLMLNFSNDHCHRERGHRQHEGPLGELGESRNELGGPHMKLSGPQTQLEGP